MKKVIAVKANEDFSLELKFNDNSVRKFDARPYLDFGGYSGCSKTSAISNKRESLSEPSNGRMSKISAPILYISRAGISKIPMTLRWQKEIPSSNV